MDVRKSQFFMGKQEDIYRYLNSFEKIQNGTKRKHQRLESKNTFTLLHFFTFNEASQ